MPSADCTCDLCGLSLRGGAVQYKAAGKIHHFCCSGCLQVFRMLLQASEGIDPGDFKSTEIFKQCRAMGIIPASEEDLANAVSQKASVENPSGETLRLHLSVGGMWCPSCGWVIEKSLAQLPGIFQAACSFSTDTFQCVYDPVLTSPQKIIDRIKELGYTARVPGETATRREDRREFIRFAVSAFLTMNVMMLSFALYTGFFNDLTQSGIRYISLPILLLAGTVFFFGGAQIHRKAWRGLLNGAYGMETLISLGATCAFAYSIWSIVKGSLHLYFDTSAMLITLVLMGKLLERRAKRSVLADLSHFFSIYPRKARICSETDKEGRYVSVEHLRTGDLFRLEAGEVSPADGVVVSGHGQVDESALTGEPIPKNKATGNSVTSGTKIMNGDFLVKAVHVGQEATLGQMIRLIETVLGQKTAMESRTDRLLKWFVPGVTCIAVATGVTCFITGLSFEVSLLRLITVLVISCPCALGIAIPLARVAGVSAAGKQGVLIRDFAAFDKAGTIDSIIFDKTGTVTLGNWRVSEVLPEPPHTEAFVLSLAAGLETGSDHATALAILNFAQAQNASPAFIEAVESFENGRAGVFGGEILRIGSASFVRGNDNSSFQVEPLCGRFAAGKSEETWSRVFLSLAGRLMAVFYFGDDIRPDAPETLGTLRRWNYRLGMVSGDAEETTREVADRLEIPERWGGEASGGKNGYRKGVADFRRRSCHGGGRR